MSVDLSLEEIDAYMLQSPRVILCVSRGEQAPLPLPMWFGWIEGKIVMHTLLSSKKVAQLKKHPRVSCLVESGEAYFTIKAVLMMGLCEVSEDQEDVRETIQAIKQSKPLYDSLRPEEWPPHLQRHYALPRAVLRVTPESVTTWDFSKIRT